MEVNFKYEIGQLLTTTEAKFACELTRIAVAKIPAEGRWQLKAGGETRPIIIHVLSRVMEECPGGVQLHYLCGYFAGGYVSSKFLEHQLAPYPEELQK